MQILIQAAWHAVQLTKEDNKAIKNPPAMDTGGLRGRRLVYRTSLYWAVIKRRERLRQVTVYLPDTLSGIIICGMVSMYITISYNCFSLKESIFLDVFPKEKPTP